MVRIVVEEQIRMASVKSDSIFRHPSVLLPTRSVKRCKGCGEPISQDQRWCSPSCQRSEDPSYDRDDETEERY